MPAAADQEGRGYNPDSIRTTGTADNQYPPMQHQQWHAVPDPYNNPNGERATIYSDDERIVCQTHGTWKRGPSNEERPHVLAMIAAAPNMRKALEHIAGHWKAAEDEGNEAYALDLATCETCKELVKAALIP